SRRLGVEQWKKGSASIRPVACPFACTRVNAKARRPIALERVHQRTRHFVFTTKCVAAGRERTFAPNSAQHAHLAATRKVRSVNEFLMRRSKPGSRSQTPSVQ